MFDFLKNRQKDTDNDKADPVYADELIIQADGLVEKGDMKKAEKIYLKALDILIALYEEAPDDYRTAAAKCADSLGSVYENMEKYTDAFEEYSLVAQLLAEKEAENNPDMLEQLADAYCNIGDTYFFRERYDEAEKEYNRAMEIYIRLLNLDGGEYLEDIAYCYDCLAKSCSGKEDYIISIEHYEKVIEIYEKLISDYKGSPLDGESIELHDELAAAYGDIGYICSCIKNYEDAESYYIKAAQIYRDLAVNDHDTYSDSLSSQYADLAALYEDIGNTSSAREYYEKSQNLDI